MAVKLLPRSSAEVTKLPTVSRSGMADGAERAEGAETAWATSVTRPAAADTHRNARRQGFVRATTARGREAPR